MTEQIKNSNLTAAKKAKNDEFYTQYLDIEREMQAYLDYDENVFRGKTILLPCDDPEWSNFTKYFAQNFHFLGIKKLISTSYAYAAKSIDSNYEPSDSEKNSPQYDADKSKVKGKIFTLTHDSNQDGVIDLNDLEWEYLEGDGDFRSDEIKALRDEADIIITNPPFSLFREFLAWIVEANKQFSIIGNKNAITYKEVFPLIKDNKIWSGEMSMGNDILFDIPSYFVEEFTENKQAGSAYRFVDGKLKARASGMWFTNIEHGRRHAPLELMTMADNLKFNKGIIKDPNSYQKYDNYDAIEIPKTNGIPSDYTGVMGVPISFLDKYCPEQFEILGCSYSYGKPDGWDDDVNMNVSINGKPIYKRLLIQHKNQTPTKKEINHEN